MSVSVKYTQNTLKNAIDKTWKTTEESPIGIFKNKKEMDDTSNKFALLWDKKN